MLLLCPPSPQGATRGEGTAEGKERAENEGFTSFHWRWSFLGKKQFTYSDGENTLCHLCDFIFSPLWASSIKRGSDQCLLPRVGVAIEQLCLKHLEQRLLQGLAHLWVLRMTNDTVIMYHFYHYHIIIIISLCINILCILLLLCMNSSGETPWPRTGECHHR